MPIDRVHRWLLCVLWARIGGLALLLVLGGPTAGAVQTAANRAAPPQSPTDAAAAEPGGPTAAGDNGTEVPSLERVQAELERLRGEPESDEQTQTALVDSYTQAAESLASLAAAQAQLAELRGAVETAPERLRRAQQALAEPVELDVVDVDPWSPAEQIITAKQTAETQLETLRQQLDALRSQIRARREESQLLPQQVVRLQDRLQQLQATPGATDDLPPRQAEARRVQREAAIAAARAELALAEQKLRAYEAESPLLPVQQTQLERRVAAAETQLRRLTQLAAEQRQAQIRALIDDLEQLHAAAPLAQQKDAAATLELARRWPPLVQKAATAESRMVDLRRELLELKTDLAKTESLVETDIGTGRGLSPAVGFLLQRKLSKLPPGAMLDKAAAALADDMEAGQALLTEIETELEDLPPPPAEEAGGPAAEEPPLLAAQRDVLRRMRADAERYVIETLIPLGVQQEVYATTVDAFEDLIGKHLLWVQSESPLQAGDVMRVPAALGWLFGWQNLRSLGQALVRIGNTHSGLAVLWVVTLVALLSGRPRLRNQLRGLGDLAQQPSGTRMRTTFAAMLLSLVLALPLALLLALPGYLLATQMGASLYVRSVGWSLLLVAVLVLPLELLRQVVRHGGLASNHFGWADVATTSTRTTLRWLMHAVVPLILVWRIAAEGQDGQLELSVLARLLFVLIMASVAVLAWRFTDPRRGAISAVIANHPDGWLDRLAWLWRPLLVAIPLVLALLSMYGYSYSATHLAARLLRTVWMLTVVTIVGGVVTRWLLIAKRRLAMQQMRRRASERAAAAPAADAGSIEVSDADMLDVSHVSAQTQRMLDALLFVGVLIGLYIIWRPVLPALAFLDRVTLWTQTVADSTAVGGTVTEAVTLSNLLLAIPIVVLTIVVVRNAPGLIETAVLQRLPLENAVRYAITTLSSYLLAAVGILVAADTLGVRWEKLQWLVAGLGVGLGFGLQEIFANFISGIILLFEQPIRVGDIVTLENETGTVSRIRMRATTITNWDRQELIVPNKELITGRLINWTLSDGTNRVVVNVGVAYGSDTRRAVEILYEIVGDHPRVAKSIPPLVTFEGFGDSTLNLVVRCYLTTLENRLSTIHDLHTAINDRFNEAGIEIAFPQRDLHLRSLPKALTAMLTRQGDGRLE